MYQYPYGNAQQLNLDWILSKLQELESGSGSGGADLEEVANALVSASFDAGVQYRRYDYCFYNGKLYRALNDNSGAFNPADWLEVVIGDDIPVLTRLLNAVNTSLTSLQNTVNDLDSDDIDNASNVTGTSVSDALETLDTAITNLQNALGDIDSDDVENASTVTGTTVTSALDNLKRAIGNIFYAAEEVDAADYNTLPIGLVYNLGVGANCPTSTGYILVLSLGRAPNHNQINAQFGIDLYDGVSLWYRGKSGATWGAWINLTKRNDFTLTKSAGTSTYTSGNAVAVNGLVACSMYVSPTENKAKDDILFTFDAAYTAKATMYTRMVAVSGEVYGVVVKANEHVIKADTAIPSGKEFYGQFIWAY